MNSSPLVPTPIVDKNGRQTTVHRRSADQSASAKTMPAPAVSPSKPSSDLSPYQRRQLAEGIDSAARVASGSGRSKELVQFVLYSYPDELLLRIEEIQRDKPEGIKLVNYLIMEGVGADEVSEMIHFSPLMEKGIKLFVAQNILRSLHNYPHLPSSKDYSKESPEVLAKAESIVRVKDAMFSFIGVRMFMGMGSTIEDESLITLAVDNADKSVLIAASMKARQTTDVELLREVLRSDSMPVSDGVL